MIFTLIIKLLSGLIVILLTPLPSLPAISSSITTVVTYVINQIIGVISLLQMIYSTTIFFAVIALLLALLVFENVYHGIFWVLRKIPMLGIS